MLLSRVKFNDRRRQRKSLFFLLLAIAGLISVPVVGQSEARSATGVIKGIVRDAQGHPIAGSTVHAMGKDQKEQSVSTAADGSYEFSGLAAGDYALRAEKDGCGNANVVVGPGEAKRVDLKLAAGSKGCESAQTRIPDFFDDPKFTVAGVTDATSPGGHGSNTVLRTTESLARETASLGQARTVGSSAKSSGEYSSALGEARAHYQKGDYKQARTAAKALLAREDKPEVHRLLAEVEEKSGNPLAAVHEYQRAAEMDPSEPNVFDWGSELLLHRALVPATEVFTQGNSLHPKSARMLIGLGVTWYARGSYDQAALRLGEASDLDEKDPTPYLFMGRILEAEVIPPKGILDRMAKFAEVFPDDAQAQYYYAVSLWKGRKPADGSARAQEVLSHLEKAVQLDPKLGSAYVEMGVVHSASGASRQAIADYQKGIAVSPELPEAHYRLAQLYGRLGERAKAQEELELYQRASNDEAKKLERERRAIQDFVYTQQSQEPANQEK
jgi:tetratricopeptide (TPR) repeat protein